MIGAYTLESLLKKYGIDSNKVLNKNNNILEYGEYQDIDRTLNYLVNELHINVKNIEKSPSIMYYAVNNIKENYEFLLKSKINISNIETTLHILSTNPKDLKDTYNYILNNYGIEYINRTTSILRINIDRIKQIEKLLKDKLLVISASISKLSIDEIREDIIACQKYNISVTGNVFRKTSEEIEKIVSICQKYNILVTGSVFLKTSEELEKSIEYIKNKYGEEYLVPLIINKNVKHLEVVLPYLESLGVLSNVIKSASILTLTLEEIKERQSYIESQGESLVLSNGRFNSVFGMSRANYKKLTKSKLSK